MAANLKKAGSVIRKSFRSSKYSVFGLKDNSILEESPGPKWSARRESDADSEVEVDGMECPQTSASQHSQTKGKGKVLRRTRSSVVTQSMREAVVNIRQKLRMSTRRHVTLKENTTPTRAGKRRQSFGGVKSKSDVQMYSPFYIDTPTRNRNRIKTCINMETPTRLRREVEALTANMQALSALTPNTLQTRSSTRKSPPITNGSLKTPRSNRRRVVTEV